jgi:hypothetical protein
LEDASHEDATCCGVVHHEFSVDLEGHPKNQVSKFSETIKLA